MAGRKFACVEGELHYIVESIASGILSLANAYNPLSGVAGNRKRKHRYILELLAEKLEVRSSYLELVTVFTFEDRHPTNEEWRERWVDTISHIAETISGTIADAEKFKVFLEWRGAETVDQHVRIHSQRRDNIFRYPHENPKLQIRVGSIHSVKGETHTSTLVMDTYFHGHHLSKLKPWLFGERTGKCKEKVRNLSRLKQHYVAMTRPSHLLCLAMRENAFTPTELAKLKSASWRVARVITDAKVIWL